MSISMEKNKHGSTSLCWRPSSNSLVDRTVYQMRGASGVPYKDFNNCRTRLFSISSWVLNSSGKTTYISWSVSPYRKAVVTSIWNNFICSAAALEKNNRTVTLSTTGAKISSQSTLEIRLTCWKTRRALYRSISPFWSNFNANKNFSFVARFPSGKTIGSESVSFIATDSTSVWIASSQWGASNMALASVIVEGTWNGDTSPE